MDQSKRKLLIGSLFGAVVLAAALPSACAMRAMRRGTGNPLGKAPTRPSGSAKPMLEDDIAPVLARLDQWYAAHLPAGDAREGWKAHMRRGC